MQRTCVFVISAVLVAGFARATTVTSIADTGLFNPDELTADKSNGDLYVTGFANGGTTDSVNKVSGGGLLTLYSPLPATTGGDLQYTNGFTVDSSTLWWNNANAGPVSLTEFSRAPKSGAGPIVRNSPSDDLDALSFSGTALYAAHYQGFLYTVDGSGNLSFLGSHRLTSHLSIAAENSSLYVTDNSGAYVRNADGSFTDLNFVSNTYRTGGARSAVGGGNLYALDRNTLNGFWVIPTTGGAGSFITDPSFTNLTSIGYYNGLIFVSDRGETTGDNNTGHVWQVQLPEPGSALISLIGLAVVARRPRRAVAGVRG
jgi:hypothetical protein